MLKKAVIGIYLFCALVYFWHLTSTSDYTPYNKGRYDTKAMVMAGKAIIFPLYMVIDYYDNGKDAKPDTQK